MKFEIFCAGACRDNGKPTQIAGAGVVLESENEDGYSFNREFGYPLGSSNSALAEIQALRLALASIIPSMRHYPVTVYLLGFHALQILATKDNEYVVTPSKNKEEVGELRKWYAQYPNIKLEKGDVKTGNLSRAKELAKKALDTQEEFDSKSCLNAWPE